MAFVLPGGRNEKFAVCLVCDDEQEEPHRRPQHQARHEQSNAHRQNLYLRQLHANANGTPAPDSLPRSQPDSDICMEDPRFQLIDSGIRGLLGSLYDTFHAPADSFEDPTNDDSSHTATHAVDQNFWNLHFERDERPHTFDQSQVHEEMASWTAGMLDIYSQAPVDADFEFDAPSDSEYDPDKPLHEIPDDVEFDDPDVHPTHEQDEDDSHWFSGDGAG
ncbi:hypothetical protein CPB85DRAFT_1295784 [Mucidula mucida]|nr:hypothetical protein CPB85DRAFT_1295784 [Mucidula mucida]